MGVEDFGFRRGHASGTILVDLERRRVVDLFEGHSVESIARWLGQHPSVEVVGRDRSNVCREGAWKAYCRRFDLEHTIRFLKQTLSWTTPRFRHPEQADRWTWLVLAAYTQLRLARAIVADGASLALSTHHPRP